MYYDTINEAKAAYMEAYEWANKVQRACLLEHINISVEAGFCRANYDLGSEFSAWTIEVSIWDEKTQSLTRAEWKPWNAPEVFEEEKKAVEAYINDKGVTI